MLEATTPRAVPLDERANVTDVLERRVHATPDAPLFAVPTEDGGWSDVAAREFHARVQRIAKGLIAAGLEPGDRIGLLCRTRYEWTLIDFAIWYAGAVMVPVYDTSSPAQVQWNLSDSGAVALIVENAENANRFALVRDALPDVTRLWRLDEGALEALEEAGAAISDEELEARRAATTGSDIATLIYTSGSSGSPKGCVLTHTNFVDLTRNAAAAMATVAYPGASSLLFITLAHVYARLISVLAVEAGVRVGHQADLSLLLPAL